MDILGIILALILLAIVIVLLLALQKPKVTAFSRSTTINAPIEAVFTKVDSLRDYNDWNPWALDDLEQKVTFEGEDGAIGSKMSWVGEKTGEGVMTIAQSNGTDMVQYDLEFIKPFSGQSTAILTLSAAENGTNVNWAYSSDNPFFSRIIMVFMNFEKMIGTQYERGLARLKDLVEKG